MRQNKIPVGQKIKSFGKYILTVILIMMVLSGVYSLFSGQGQSKEEIALSQLATEVSNGNVEKIAVHGDNLQIILKEGGEKISKKETETSLSETFANYGVPKDKISQVAIEIKEPAGFLYWLGNILPFLIPFLFILVFFWFIARQARSRIPTRRTDHLQGRDGRP